jgi:hypothetical protein
MNPPQQTQDVAGWQHFQLIINTKKNYNIVNRRMLVLAGVPGNLKLLFSRPSHASHLVWMRSMQGTCQCFKSVGRI